MKLLLMLLATCSSPQHWETDANVAYTRAKVEHRRVLVHIYAGWAMQSVKLDRELRAADLSDYVPLLVDVTNDDSHVWTVPIIELHGSDGTLLRTIRTVLDADELADALR